jgi:AcrR family transcriptional regulator
MTEQERRMQIKEAAKRLFGRKAFNQVTTTELAEEAGLSRALVYRYGASKTDILEDIFRDLISGQAEALRKMPLPRGSAVDRVMVYLTRMFELDIPNLEVRRLAVQHSWTWGPERESEFFVLIGKIMDPISKSLEEAGVERNLDDRIAIWAIYTEGLRQTMARMGDLTAVDQKQRAKCAKRFQALVQGQIERLLT